MSIFKDEKGFTLMEAIISIAALALISGFILQMFLVASNVNVSASEIDKGNTIVFSEIERMKKEDSMQTYLQNSLLEEGKVAQTDKGYILTKHYDKDFTQILKSEIETYITSGEKYFVMEIAYETIEEKEAGVLYSATATITRHETKVVNGAREDAAKEIVRLSASKYFTN